MIPQGVCAPADPRLLAVDEKSIIFLIDVPPTKLSLIGVVFPLEPSTRASEYMAMLLSRTFVVLRAFAISHQRLRLPGFGHVLSKW